MYSSLAASLLSDGVGGDDNVDTHSAIDPPAVGARGKYGLALRIRFLDGQSEGSAHFIYV